MIKFERFLGQVFRWTRFGFYFGGALFILASAILPDFVFAMAPGARMLLFLGGPLWCLCLGFGLCIALFRERFGAAALRGVAILLSVILLGASDDILILRFHL